MGQPRIEIRIVISFYSGTSVVSVGERLFTPNPLAGVLTLQDETTPLTLQDGDTPLEL